MLHKILSKTYVQILIISAALGGLVLCIFPDKAPCLYWISNYAVQLMLLYLFAGLLFLILKQPRIVFTLFTSCILLCFYLKYSVKNDGIERWRQTVIKNKIVPPQQETEITIAHINLSNSIDINSTIEVLRNSKADVLSIHELTPKWDLLLEDSLCEYYPNYLTLVDIGLYGMAIYSKLPLEKVDTFYYEGIPNLRGYFKKENKVWGFISVHTEPTVNASSRERLQNHLELIAHEANKFLTPVIVFGDFNAVPWFNQIQDFLHAATLMDSRTGFMQEASSIWAVPLDHIFFSNTLQCVDFRSLQSLSAGHLGIKGVYQPKRNSSYVKKTAQ